MLWTIGWDQLVREERHKLCVGLATDRMEMIAGKLIRYISYFSSFLLLFLSNILSQLSLFATLMPLLQKFRSYLISLSIVQLSLIMSLFQFSFRNKSYITFIFNWKIILPFLSPCSRSKFFFKIVLSS